MTVNDEQRPKIQAYFDSWIVDAALRKPGPWVERFRPKLVSLTKSINLEVESGVPSLTCAAADRDTLLLLARGCQWFDGIDHLEAQVIRVITTTNRNFTANLSRE